MPIIVILRSRLNPKARDKKSSGQLSLGVRLDLGLVVGGARSCGRNLRQALPGLPFPLRNHVGVQMLGSELGRLVADQGLQGDFGLELGGEARRFPMVLP